MGDLIFSNFKNTIKNFTDVKNRKDLLIKELGDLRIYYAPFDYVNPKARLFIIGITPGEQQMKNMLGEARRLIDLGLSDEEVLKQCKTVGSFSGPMRKNLVQMMDHIGLAKYLKIKSCEELFNEHAELGNLTSAIRYPTFLNEGGKEKNFNDTIKPKSELFKFAASLTLEEIEKAPNALLLPLGPKVSTYLKSVLARTPFEKNLLPALPHPSGANAERIAYFLGRKDKKELSSKTNPNKIDSIKLEFEKILKAL